MSPQTGALRAEITRTPEYEYGDECRHTYGELSELFALAPHADLSPADHARADAIAHDDSPNAELPWVRGQLVTFGEFRRLFQFTPHPPPESPPKFTHIKSEKKKKPEEAPPRPLTHDEAAAIFEDFMQGKPAPFLGAAHRKLWEDAHPGCPYDITPATPEQHAANRRAESAAWRKKSWEDANPGKAYDPARYDAPPSEPGGQTASPSTPPKDKPRLYNIEAMIAQPDLLIPREDEQVAAYVAYRKALLLLPGREKDAGKSTLLSAAAGAVVNRLPFLGRPTVHGPVLWITADLETAGDITKRAVRFGATHDLHVLYPRSGAWKDRLAELEDTICDLKPVWVIIDTLPNWVAGVVEKASQSDQWPSVLLPLRRIMQQYNLAITLAHHTKKDALDYRDSSAIGATPDLIVMLTKHKTQATWRELTAKGRWTLDPITVALEDNRYRIVGGVERAGVTEAGQARQCVYDALVTEVSVAELVEKTGLTKNTVRRHLDELGPKVASRVEKRGPKKTKTVLYRRAAEFDAIAPADLSDVAEEGDSDA